MRQLNTLKKRMLLLLVALFSLGYAYAQIEVSGKLTGPNGAGLVGAEVREKGTNNGTMVLEDDGSWSLTVKGPESVLTFTLATYGTQERTVGTNRNFPVRLQPDAEIMTSVVVVGYGVSRPEDVTGGITQLTGSDVSKAPVLAVDQALQGKAAGVQVRANSGRPGGGMDIVVRGRGTAGDARPLYVVDGVAVGYEWRGDPSNIESISILKDASSCAIYGARGANGVVLITTRGGNAVAEANSDYINVSFDAYIGGQEAWKKLDVMSGQQYAIAQNEKAKQSPNYKPGEEPFPDLAALANTNWQDEVFQKGLIDKFKITLDGGSARSSWSASVGSTKQEGIVKGSGYQRYDAGYKSMWKLNNYIDLGVNMGFNQNTSDILAAGDDLRNTVLGNALIAPPVTPVYENGQLAGTYKYKNPMGLILKNDVGSNNFTNEEFGLGTGAWVNIKVPGIKGLEFKTQADYGRWERNEEVYVPEFMISQKNNQFNETSFLQNTISGGYKWSVSNTLTYTKKFYNADSTQLRHSLRLLAGHEALYEYQDGYRVRMDNVPEEEDMRYPSMGKIGDNAYTVPSWLVPMEHTMLSYIGRAEYGFMDKYLINGTVRRDGSSRFGGNNKFGVFPSVGVAWKVNKESFFYSNEWLKNNVSMFKIRGGWGKIGNENIGDYLFLSQYGQSVLSGYSFGGARVNGAVPLATVNPDIKWEEATSWNVGTDINMFNNKIMFNYDFFIKHNYDNLIKIAVPTVAGVDEVSGSWPTVNAGTIRNYGSEFSLTYQNQYLKENAKHAFTYSVNANFTIINNEVTGMDGGVLYGGRVQPQNILLTETREGYPIAAFFGYKVDGVFNSWEEVNKGVQKDAKPGDFKIVDVDGDGDITPNDMTYIGNPHPKFSYGLNLDMGYAGFDLSFAFQGVQGNDIFNVTKWYLDGGFEESNMSTRRLDAWSESNRSSEPTDPTWFTSKNVNGNGIFPNSAFIENGSYFRLKNVTLGYTLPERISKKFFMQKLRVYVQAQNVFTITKYSGMDPEIGSNEDTNWEGPEFGIDRGVYPQARTFVYGVNITF